MVLKKILEIERLIEFEIKNKKWFITFKIANPSWILLAGDWSKILVAIYFENKFLCKLPDKEIFDNHAEVYIQDMLTVLNRLYFYIA